MKTFPKTILFIVLYTVIFIFLRQAGSQVGYNVDALTSDLGGLAYLYSTVGLIFAIFAASVMVFESQRWDNLIDSVKSEVSELDELWAWSALLENEHSANLHNNIKKYLEISIANIKDLASSREALVVTVEPMRKDIFQLAEKASPTGQHLMDTLDNFIEFRTRRINYSVYQLPKILKGALLFNTILLIVLSYLIGVHNVWLNYIFLISVTTLTSFIYFIIDDMDNPYRAGNWQIEATDFEKLLKKLS